MGKISILWADDEINLLKPHIIFLEEKGYEVSTTNNGDDAIDLLEEKNFDIVFLDEQMPGLSGIETLEIIKNKYPELPVVMITKSEEEDIMEEAIGSKISDYLIKPVKPNQILLAIKKNIDHKKLVSEKTSSNYQQEFRKIGMTLLERPDDIDWKDLYKKLVYWELELAKSENEGMFDILKTQKEEANNLFGKYIASNYVDWLNNPDEDTPIFSHTLFKKKIKPHLDEEAPVFFILIDNFRYDQWATLRPLIKEYYNVDEEDMYHSLLPTSTQYARNAIFAGLTPLDIQKKYPKLWTGENEEGSKNKHESELLDNLLTRLNTGCKFSYNKILSLNEGKNLASNISQLYNNKLNVIVYNFVDMLSHARTEMEMIRELAENDSAYRSITKSWFEHSPLFDILKQLSAKNIKVVISTDHGSIRVKNPDKIVGDRNSSSNLRYKQGRNLSHKCKNLLEVKKPSEIFLPQDNISTSYIFANSNNYFVYPNNYNYYAQHFKGTFQHGGISLEEMLIPVITLSSK